MRCGLKSKGAVIDTILEPQLLLAAIFHGYKLIFCRVLQILEIWKFRKIVDILRFQFLDK